MDRAYANALKRKEEIEAELARIDSFLDLYRHFAGPEGEQVEPLPDGISNEEPAQSRVTRFPKPSEIADMAERVIRGADHPLTRADIVSRLESAGVSLNSDDKPRYVGTILWREKARFTNIPGQGYVMADMATPEQHAMDLIERGSGKEPEDEKEKSAFE
ncbi:hypothetical protein [Mesorhizobium sp. Cs1299R1N3]|uniref:hypothetical protein n=1 Tax=Mesorhizobium sp. Cs1299R1N3 TaxID=3015173 RepID=UPI00301E391C